MKQVRVRVGERWYSVEVGDPQGTVAMVKVDGESFEVEIESLSVQRRLTSPEPTNQPAPAHRPPSASHPPGETGDGIIKSPMSGKILAVKIKPGDEVSAGDEVCIVEAMKMEQSIRSHRSGKVKAVHVKPLQQVTIHAPLIEVG